MSQGFPYLGLIWLCYQLYTYFANRKDSIFIRKDNSDLPAEASPEKRIFIEYISNGKTIYGCHMYHYVEMINLMDAERIDEYIIEHAARKRRSLINKIDYDNDFPVSSVDVDAAKEYLLDRWFYMTAFN